MIQKRASIGIVEPSNKCGYGPTAMYESLQRSAKGQGLKVLAGTLDECLPATFLVGIEEDFSELPPEVQARAFNIDYAVLAQRAMNSNGSARTGGKIVGMYHNETVYRDLFIPRFDNDTSDDNVDYNRLKRFGDDMFCCTGFTLEDDIRNILDKNAEEEREGTAILIGGAPPPGIRSIVFDAAYTTRSLQMSDKVTTLFAGDVQSPKEKFMLEMMQEAGYDVQFRTPHQDYLSDLSTYEIIITKPGWNAMSELIYMTQVSSETPVVLVVADDKSAPEYISSRVLKSLGFKIYDDYKQAGAVVSEIRNDQTLRTLAKRETKELCDSIKVQNLLQMFLEDVGLTYDPECRTHP